MPEWPSFDVVIEFDNFSQNEHPHSVFREVFVVKDTASGLKICASISRM